MKKSGVRNYNLWHFGITGSLGHSFTVLALASWLISQTQGVSRDAATIPVKKPTEILQFASARNGVDVPSAQPWHVEVTYDQFDEHGDRIHSGTVEEYYFNPKKYRLSYSSDELKRTDIATETGLYREGEQRWPSLVELQILDEALRPFYRLDLHGRCTWSLKDTCTRPDKVNWSVGGVKLRCIIIDRTDTLISDGALPKYCFEDDKVPLRYTRGQGLDETIYNNFTVFQDRYVAHDAAVMRAGKPFLKIHLRQLETIVQPDDGLFRPAPASTGPLGGRITLPSDVLMDRYLVHQEYPLFAHHTPGKVTVRFLIGKDGQVFEAEALDGQEEMRKASLDAIRKSKFRPYLVLGEPVEVESQTVFEFNTGSGIYYVRPF
jgi:hypothetical protein